MAQLFVPLPSRPVQPDRMTGELKILQVRSVSSDRATIRPMMKPLNIIMNRGRSIKKLCKNMFLFFSPLSVNRKMYYPR